MRGKKVAVIRHENQKSSVIGCQLSPHLSWELLGVLCFPISDFLKAFLMNWFHWNGSMGM